MIHNIELNTTPASICTASCVVVAVYNDEQLSPSLSNINKDSNGYISDFLAKGHLSKKLGSSIFLFDVNGISTERLLLIRCGNENELDKTKYNEILNSVYSAIKHAGIVDACLYLSELVLKNINFQWKLSMMIESAYDVFYPFTQFKSKVELPQGLKKLSLGFNAIDDVDKANQVIKQAIAISNGKSLAKSLANMPANICTPEYITHQALKLEHSYKNITIKILEESDLKDLGMGAFLAVSQGSKNAGKFVIIEYKGDIEEAKPHVFVGKGITFDSGGLSLKPAEPMMIMKFDMCGAAAVYGTLVAVAELQLKINVVGILALAENMPSDKATRPGDIVTTMSGKTVEIVNTDAEGRLVLCDALTYVQRYQPQAVIDVATLTGATLVALGTEISALYSNNIDLSKAIETASHNSSDLVWKMPLHRQYGRSLSSYCADMKNKGDKNGGSIIAACFLAEFAGDYPWAHLDIAGPAIHFGQNNNATGRPVPLLTQYCIDNAG